MAATPKRAQRRRKRRCGACARRCRQHGIAAIAALAEDYHADQRHAGLRRPIASRRHKACCARRCIEIAGANSRSLRAFRRRWPAGGLTWLVAQRKNRQHAPSSAKSMPMTARRCMCRARAPYIDDMREPEGCVHVVPGFRRDAARGRITAARSCGRARAVPASSRVLTADDIPGTNDCSPSIGGDPILADGEIIFHGQVIFAVVAETREAARRAARLARIEIAAEKPAVTVDDALCASKTRMCCRTLCLRAARREAALRMRAKHASTRVLPHRRAGAFLSRRPGRHGASARSMAA